MLFKLTSKTTKKLIQNCTSVSCDNNNSYIVLYPIKIHKLTVLYIINIKIHLTIIKKAQVL